MYEIIVGVCVCADIYIQGQGINYTYGFYEI